MNSAALWWECFLVGWLSGVLAASFVAAAYVRWLRCRWNRRLSDADLWRRVGERCGAEARGRL